VYSLITIISYNVIFIYEVLITLNRIILLFSYQNIAETLSIEESRVLYEQAKTHLKTKDFAQFQKIRNQLNDYPLVDYLDYQYAVHFLNNETSVVEDFIQTHPKSYLGSRLHSQYSLALAKQKKWTDLIKWYTPKGGTTASKCTWLYAKYQQGDQHILQQVSDIWIEPNNRPNECDNLFKAWFSSAHFHHDFAWQRFLSAIKVSQRGIARYSASLLPTDLYQNFIDRIWDLYAHPEQIKNIGNYPANTSEMQDIIVYGIAHYAKSNPINASVIWEEYKSSNLFSERAINSVHKTLVNQLLRHDLEDAATDLLTRTPSIRSHSFVERLLRLSLKKENWHNIVNVIEWLPETAQQSERWLYWQTRAKRQLKEITRNDAKVIYARLATQRSYYGFLSADRIDQPYKMNNEAHSIALSKLGHLAQIPAFQRANELRLAGYPKEAQAEWYYGLLHLDRNDIVAAGVLADNWAWYNGGITAMIHGKHWNHLNIRFPLAYKEQILTEADTQKLTSSFIFAIARQESAMFEHAVSRSGARGLMQLMPATAKETAGKLGIAHQPDDLFNPTHNIKLGSQYLRQMLERYDNNRILAAASYNAGPNRVARWKTETGLDFDTWIETIPFKETRAYVQNVLAYAVIYQQLMGQQPRLLRKHEAKAKL